jgi:signal transduction histidine kinase
MTFDSLRLRLLLAGAVSTVLALLLAAYVLTVLFERHVERRIDQELNLYLDQLTAQIEPSPSGALALARQPADPRFEKPLSGLYWQIIQEPTGNVLRSRSLWDFELQLPAEMIDNAVHHHRVGGPERAQLYLLQRRVELPSRLGGGTARIAVALDTAEVKGAVGQFASDLMPLFAIIGGLLIAAAWFQVSVGLSPLATVRSRLAAIRSGDSRRLGSKFPSEIRPMAQEIDELLDARDQELARARTRAADLAHGLRTPLQVIHAEIERLRENGQAALASNLRTATETMQRNVERELARVRLAGPMKDASADIGTAIDQVLRVIQRTPDGQRLDWLIAVPKDVAARIDRDDLSEAVGNLLENAARHARHAVSITCGREGKYIAFSVTDDGAGIPEDRRAEALARGGRLDERGPGSGLGLAIVTDIVESWGGTLTLAGADPGLRAIIKLPGSGSSPN